jgi:hypothetical protein
MGSPVGGNPTSIEAGASQLSGVVSSVNSDGAGVSVACAGSSAAGNAALVASIDRFSAGWSKMLEDLSLQIYAAKLLAQNGGQDLVTATGGNGPR